MKRNMKLSTGLALVAAGLLTVAGLAHADVTKKVQRAFRGTILITDTALPDTTDSAKKTIELYKKQRKPKLEHQDETNGVASWSFYYTAFMKRPPRITSMSIDFYTEGGKYVANKRLMGINPKYTVLTGFMSITEDDGLTRGKDYVIKLVGTVSGRERTFAKTKLKML